MRTHLYTLKIYSTLNTLQTYLTLNVLTSCVHTMSFFSISSFHTCTFVSFSFIHITFLSFLSYTIFSFSSLPFFGQKSGKKSKRQGCFLFSFFRTRSLTEEAKRRSFFLFFSPFSLFPLSFLPGRGSRQRSCQKTKCQARFFSFLFPFFFFQDQAAERGVVGKPNVEEKGDMETGEFFFFLLSICIFIGEY
jgi:hypothetical protein